MRRLIKAEWTMLMGEIKQYYLNYIFYNAGMVILFFGLFYNYYYEASDTKVLAMLICAILWQTCTNGIQYLCYLIQDEAMMGTLEQMFLTKTNFFSILFSKIFVNLLFVILKGTLLFFVCTLLFHKVSMLMSVGLMKYIEIIIIIVITLFSFYCIGGVFGGLSLYYKRISSILNVVDYFLLMFTGIIGDIHSYNSFLQNIIRILPITNANILINGILSDCVSLGDVILFVVTVSAFIVVGIVVLNLLIKEAKKEGKLGQY